MSRRARSLIAVFTGGVSLLLLTTPMTAAAREIYVAPSGRSANDGSASAPLDLGTALSSSSPARPGDTIWLRGGTYRGTYVSYLTGTASAPIIVRQYPGERAIIDTSPSQKEGILAYGGWTWFWGFEIMSSDPNRFSSQTGSWPTDLRRGGGITSRGRALKFINLTIHDTVGAFGVWTESVDTEVYGNILYYNGWQAPDRAHGHAIYTQNQVGRQVIADNIVFDQFSHGMHSYGSGAAFLNNITMEGNISFNNGVVSRDGPSRELLLGGGPVAHNPVVKDNSTYGAAQVNVGYGTGCTNATITGNYFIGSGVFVANCAGSMQGNTMYSIYGLNTLPTGLTANSFYTSLPSGLVIRVRPNRYEPGRAHIAIYNWDQKPQVEVNLEATGLSSGQAFEIRDAQNYFGTPVYSGVYSGGSVSLPMTGLPMVVPVGTLPVSAQHTSARFGAFVVVPADSVTPLAAATLSAFPMTIQPGGASVLSWSTANVSQVSIDPIGSVLVNGSTTVRPTATTTYTLNAQSSTGPVVRSVVVAVAASPANVAPAITLTLGSASTFTAPASILMNANASDSDGSVARVDFYQNGTLLGSDTASPHAWSWSGVAAGAYTLTAVATDNSGATTTSAPVSISVTAATGGGTGAGGATAVFQKLDSTTKGTWRGQYGTRGYWLFGGSRQAPTYAKLSTGSLRPFRWESSTTDVRALQKVTGSGRFASSLHSYVLDIKVHFSDSQTHRLAVYVVDWDRGNRRQTVEILDASTGAVLDRRTLSNYFGGQYLVWTVGGNVRVKMSTLSGPNAVISAVFVD